MSSPNEPGYPRAADGPGNANGALPDESETGSIGNAMGRGHVTDPGDTPPWQRGPAARAQQAPPRPAREPPARSRIEAAAPPATPPVWTPASTASSPAGRASAPDRRPAATPPHAAAAAQQTRRRAANPRNDPPPRSEPRNEAPVSEAYASELPDLSAGIPRTPPRKAAPERSEPPARAAAPGRVQVASRPQAGPVRASMQIRRIDPWSALKVSLVLSVALFFVWMIAVAFLYLVLGGMGVWSKLNSNVGDLLTSAGGQSGGELVSSGTIFGGAALIGLVNIVLLTAMATVGVFIYNLTTDLVGGIEVTLADRD